jgi:ankyrin repeat protein
LRSAFPDGADDKDMTSRIITRVAPGLLMGLVAAAALPGHHAMAQAALPQPTSMGPVVQGGNGNQAAQPSVAGLPGSRRSGPVNQGTIDSTLLSPNDELFDSINRGDITAARDALSRGADLGATDAVGQTPIDLSVSLARNNITFLLVTLLHAGGGDITDAQGPMAQPPANTIGLSSKDQKAVSTPVGFFSAPQAPKAKRYQTVSTHPGYNGTNVAESAPAYASDSGSPNASAGFVGFGANAQ